MTCWFLFNSYWKQIHSRYFPPCLCLVWAQRKCALVLNVSLMTCSKWKGRTAMRPVNFMGWFNTWRLCWTLVKGMLRDRKPSLTCCFYWVDRLQRGPRFNVWIGRHEPGTGIVVWTGEVISQRLSLFFLRSVDWLWFPKGMLVRGVFGREPGKTRRRQQRCV